MGYETVSLAGLTVQRQKAALVTAGFWQGDDQTSGLMGFAYPALTSATQDIGGYSDVPDPYYPFFFNAANQGLVSPVFSLALGSNAAGESISAGRLVLGGIPSDIQLLSPWATVPLATVQFPATPSPGKNFSYYTIIPDDFVVNNRPLYSSSSSTAARTPIILDSGTTLIYLPSSIVRVINQAFSPPSQYVPSSGMWENDCDARPPSFAVRIGGRDFFLKGSDLLLPQNVGVDPQTGGCICGVQEGDDGTNILGDAFLRNVVAVFDLGEARISLAAK